MRKYGRAFPSFSYAAMQGTYPLMQCFIFQFGIWGTLWLQAQWPPGKHHGKGITQYLWFLPMLFGEVSGLVGVCNSILITCQRCSC